jgi:hypothetical protein
MTFKEQLTKKNFKPINHPLQPSLKPHFTPGGLRPKSWDKIPLRWKAVTPQCHLGFFSALTLVPSFHVSQIEQEAPNQLKNKGSTKFISKESCLKQMRFSKRGNVETLIPTLNKPLK